MKTFVFGDIHGRCGQLLSLLDMLPRESSDTLVFLGDLIDRGPDVPGCVDHVMNLCRNDPDNTICLRGNHEQMLLDFIDRKHTIWVEATGGGEQTFIQYTGKPWRLRTNDDFWAASDAIATAIPPEQIEFLRHTPLYHEDDHALYVHAGLENGKHPRDSSPRSEEHTSELQSRLHLVCRLLLEK